MSLTNPKDVVTEERLKDFYDGIYPYLGGMPEILANKFSRSDIYSTEEKIIGQYIDGKPLYMKVVYKTNKNSFTVGLDNPDIVLLDTYAYTTAWLKACTFNDGSGSVLIAIYDSTQDKILTGGNLSPSKVIYVFKYTKTTDSAISIGSDTDYSTTEKIVGTWIDGSPVWQDTVTTGGNVPSGATLILRTAMASTGYDTILYTK